MPFLETGFSGMKIFEPRVFADSRGYFFESYSEKVFSDAGITNPFVQDNESQSMHGVVRGLHYQNNPFAQAKLVRVAIGEVLDVAVDIRKGSPTFGKHFSIILSATNKKQLFIPRGFAHGFSVLSETCIFQYKCDNYYSKESEGGILFSDAELNIDWMIPESERIISEKDLLLPSFANCLNHFQY